MSTHDQIAMFVTGMKAEMSMIKGVIEIEWINPTHSDFVEVAVYRKLNDYAMSELDPYATEIYRGTATKIYDYCLDNLAKTDFHDAAEQTIGIWNPNTQTYDSTHKMHLLDPNSLYYYTIFSIDTDGIYHASFATTVTGRRTKHEEITEKLYDYLPAIYRLEDKKLELKRYLESLGMVLDYIMSKATNMSNFIDPDTCEPYQLDYLAYTLDWELDKSLPIPSQRQSLKTAIDIYRNAGTRKGLDALVKTNSGFPNSSGVLEGRDFTVYSTFFGYYPFDLVRYDYEATPDFDTLDPTLIGKAGDPLKYTMDFSSNARQETDVFIAYVRKTTEITQEEQDIMVDRLTKLLTRFAPAGTRFEIDVY